MYTLLMKLLVGNFIPEYTSLRTGQEVYMTILLNRIEDSKTCHFNTHCAISSLVLLHEPVTTLGKLYNSSDSIIIIICFYMHAYIRTHMTHNNNVIA